MNKRILKKLQLALECVERGTPSPPFTFSTTALIAIEGARQEKGDTEYLPDGTPINLPLFVMPDGREYRTMFEPEGKLFYLEAIL